MFAATGHAGKRRRASDRRHTDSDMFPFQDSVGEWVVTERRSGEDRRAVQQAAAARAKSRRAMVWVVGLLAVAWLLVKMAVIPAPGWLPLWIFQPELLLGLFVDGESVCATEVAGCFLDVLVG